MRFHILTAQDVRAALPMRDAIDAMRKAFGLLAGGEVDMPQRTAIEIPKHDAVTLVITTAEGELKQLPAANYVTVTSKRSYTAVRISAPETLRRTLGATHIAVEVGSSVSLVPEMLVGSADPERLFEDPSYLLEVVYSIGAPGTRRRPSACSHETRRQRPDPRGPTRSSGCVIRSGPSMASE